MSSETTDTHKHCRQCDQTLLHAAFGKNKNNPYGIHSECRECALERTRSFREARASRETSEEKRRRERANQVKSKYGITLEEAESMLAAQGGECRICGTNDFSQRTWHIDHCHTTGKVRGILCSECNLGLGKFIDDTSLLRAAIDYLEEYGDR